MKTMPTVIITDESGAQEWSGSIHEFFRANEFEPEVRAFICGILRADGSAMIGGGAAPAFTVSVQS